MLGLMVGKIKSIQKKKSTTKKVCELIKKFGTRKHLQLNKLIKIPETHNRSCKGQGGGGEKAWKKHLQMEREIYEFLTRFFLEFVYITEGLHLWKSEDVYEYQDLDKFFYRKV